MYGDYVHSIEIPNSTVQLLQLLEFAHLVQRKDLFAAILRALLGPTVPENPDQTMIPPEIDHDTMKSNGWGTSSNSEENATSGKQQIDLHAETEVTSTNRLQSRVRKGTVFSVPVSLLFRNDCIIEYTLESG